MLHKLLKKLLVFVGDKIIKAYSRTDKHLFNLWKRLDFLYKPDILVVRNLKIFAWRGGKALAVGANAVL